MDEGKCGALLAEIGAGSPEALAQLYEESARAVFAYALGIVRSRQLAEDVTQDVFVKIRLGAEKYVPSGHAGAWILRLTRNTSLDLLRRRRHEEPLTEHSEKAEKPAISDEDRIVLRAALEGLPPLERQVVFLYLVAGIPQKEIARSLSLPAASVNWKYRAALKKLARILKED